MTNPLARYKTLQ